MRGLLIIIFQLSVSKIMERPEPAAASAPSVSASMGFKQLKDALKLAGVPTNELFAAAGKPALLAIAELELFRDQEDPRHE